MDADNALARIVARRGRSVGSRWRAVRGRQADIVMVMVASTAATTDAVLVFEQDLFDFVQQLRIDVLALVGLVATADGLVAAR